MKTAYKFCFQTKSGKLRGPLAIHHAPAGGIILAMGKHVTSLSLRQLIQLHINPEELINYDQQIFEKHFDLSDKAKDQIEEIVAQDLDEMLDTLFIDLHTKFVTYSGDIAPEQLRVLNKITGKLKRLKAKLTRLMTTQIWQNK
jgi:hypothetical protein